MTLKYESEVLFDLMKRDGDDAPSDVLPYESELKEKYLEQVVGAYPKLQDYQAEWLTYNLYHHLPSYFPVESVTNVTSASFNNVVPYAYKSAILKGDTGYRDIDTGEFLETFEEGRNLELVSVKLPVLTTTGKNLFNYQGKELSCYYKVENAGNYTTNNNVDSYCVEVLPNTAYTLSCENRASISHLTFWDKNKIFIAGEKVTVDVLSRTFTTPSNCKYIKFPVHKEGVTNIQLEAGSTSTSYEPYKSNILTVNEDVTLRSNGSVYDELDLLTGKLTQRIDEDGSVLTQEVVKTVDLTCINEQGESEVLRPIEGTMHVSTSSQALPPLLDMSVPVEATTQNLMSFANIVEEE